VNARSRGYRPEGSPGAQASVYSLRGGVMDRPTGYLSRQ
jgi:hypothetical protein